MAGAITMAFEGLTKYQKRMQRAGERTIKKETKKRIRNVAKKLRKEMRAEVGSFRTNPTTRKRPRGAPAGKVGRLTGKSKTGIVFRVRVRNQTDFFAVVGPIGAKGFNLRIQAAGTNRIPSRDDFITRPTSKISTFAEAELGKVFDSV